MSLNDTALVTLIQAKAHLRVDAAASLRVDAEYVGEGDDATVAFDLDNTPVGGSLQLYVNNVLQVEDTDFAISAATVTFTAAPASPLPITASYDYAADADTFESYDDELLENLINAATKKAEDYTGRAFIERTVTETHIGNGTTILKLYKMPIVAAEAIAITVDGVELTTWSERLSIGRLYHLAVWDEYAEIVVTYTAGYAATRAATQALVPDAVAAVLMMVAYLYENRTDLVHGESVAGLGSVTYELPLYTEKSGANLLLAPLRVNLL